MYIFRFLSGDCGTKKTLRNWISRKLKQRKMKINEEKVTITYCLSLTDCSTSVCCQSVNVLYRNEYRMPMSMSMSMSVSMLIVHTNVNVRTTKPCDSSSCDHTNSWKRCDFYWSKDVRLHILRRYADSVSVDSFFLY